MRVGLSMNEKRLPAPLFTALLFTALLFTTLLTGLLSTTAFAQEQSAEALLRRYDALLAPASFEAELAMVAHREDGSTRSYEMTVLKSGPDKLRVIFSAPATAKGQEMLRDGDNMWLYMPNLKRAVRVASRDSFMGGDFNNADVLRVDYTADYTARIAGETADAYVLELKAKGPGVAYDRIKLWLSKGAEPQPRKAELYATSGKLLRTAEFSDVKDLGGGYKRPAKIVMRNELSKQRYSVMTWKSVTIKDEIPPERFTLEDLGR